MNNARRKIINNSIVKLNSISSRLESIKKEESLALVKFQSDEDKENAVDEIEEIISNIEDVISNIKDAIDTLEAADF